MELGHEPLERLVDKLLSGEVVLPDIQREYVWSGTQIPRLLDSLNHEWPVGSVLLWRTTIDVPTKTAAVVQGTPTGARPAILLDGQQRLTTLARVMAPDRVPTGQKPIDVRFHPGVREFRNANAIQKKDPRWLPVSKILAKGAQFRDLVKPLGLGQGQEDDWTDLIAGVARRIRQYLIPVQTVDVDDYETVAEIFNRVNTGGTRLSKGDLVMGSLAARWPGGRQAIEEFEEHLRRTGWGFNREVLLRIMSVLKLGSPNHIRLVEMKETEWWRDAWTAMRHAVLDSVNFLRDDARVPSLSLLPTEYVLLLICVFLHDREGKLAPGAGGELARWVYLASTFGHYSGSVETTLASDVNLLRSFANDDDPGALDALIRAAQEPRTPGARITTEDLRGKTRRSPLLKLLQLCATQRGAKSWISNRAITWDPNHNGLAVEVHHIFPKAWMRKHRMSEHPEMDTLANFAFLSKWDNIDISDKDPSHYLANTDRSVLASQWIPTDPDLWSVDRFGDFCRARRVLLANALNDMLGLNIDVGAQQDEPMGADELPEPERGAWAEDVLEAAG